MSISIKMQLTIAKLTIANLATANEIAKRVNSRCKLAD